MNNDDNNQQTSPKLSKLAHDVLALALATPGYNGTTEKVYECAQILACRSPMIPKEDRVAVVRRIHELCFPGLLRD